MSQEALTDLNNSHVHNPEIEGPLPEGFPNTGREGKVRNIYISDEEICLIASDRVSAFDQVSPTPIPGKGEILNSIAQQELLAAESAGIPTWLKYVPENNPRAAVGIRTEVQPIELIFRNYMTGSMWRGYQKTGDFGNLGLPEGWKEWQDFTDRPLFTPSSKSDIKDVYFNPASAEESHNLTGLTVEQIKELEDIGRSLFALGTKRAAERGLILVDTKYEIGLAPDGSLLIIDEVHTPDSSRFLIADGFEQTIANGEKPKSLSKEFLREVMLEKADGNEELAKELMKEPLTPDVVEEVQARYVQLQKIFTDL